MKELRKLTKAYDRVIKDIQMSINTDYCQKMDKEWSEKLKENKILLESINSLNKKILKNLENENK